MILKSYFLELTATGLFNRPSSIFPTQACGCVWSGTIWNVEFHGCSAESFLFALRLGYYLLCDDFPDGVATNRTKLTKI